MKTKQNAAPKEPNYDIAPPPPEIFHNATVAVTKKYSCVFIRLEGDEGPVVFAMRLAQGTRFRAVDLVSQYQSNDEERRLYCNVSGAKYRDLQRAAKAKRESNERGAQEVALAQMKKRARKLGFTLVPLARKRP